MSVSTTGEERVPITAEGYEQRCRELDRLRNHERRRLSGLLREARSDGALDDNPALVDLLDEQVQLERESWCSKRSSLPPRSHRRQAMAARQLAGVVRVRDIDTGDVFEHQLVGPIEGDPTNGRISIAAPIGRALIGRPRGAQVEVATPRGGVTLEVLSVAAAASPRG